MNIETWPIEKLKQWEKNPRIVSDEGFDRLKYQIDELDLYKPLLIHTDGTVLGGNMRLRVLQEKGVKDVVVSIVDAKTEEEKIKYALSDNDQVGYTEKDKLKALIEEYPTINLSQYAVHLDEPEILSDFMSQFQEVVEDEVPPIDETQTVSKLGEVYQLGRHRLGCMDSTVKENVEKLMDGKKADMVFTDPPYGIDLDVNTDVRNRSTPKFKSPNQKNYSAIIGDDKPYDPSHIFEIFSYVKEIFLWGGDYYAERIPYRNDGSFIVWDKRQESSDKMIGSSFELCWSKQKHKREIVRVLWVGLLGTESQDVRNRIHPTQKPIQLCNWFINKFSDKEQTVIDLFGGSGSTLIACEQTNRVCFMMEISPAYVDCVRKRYAKFINKEDTWQEVTAKI